MVGMPVDSSVVVFYLPFPISQAGDIRGNEDQYLQAPAAVRHGRTFLAGVREFFSLIGMPTALLLLAFCRVDS